MFGLIVLPMKCLKKFSEMYRHKKLQLLLNIKLELYNVILFFPTTLALYMTRAAARV